MSFMHKMGGNAFVYLGLLLLALSLSFSLCVVFQGQMYTFAASGQTANHQMTNKSPKSNSVRKLYFFYNARFVRHTVYSNKN